MQMHKGKCTNANAQMQMHKCKCTNANAQMRMHKCKCTKANAQRQIHKCKCTNANPQLQMLKAVGALYRCVHQCANSSIRFVSTIVVGITKCMYVLSLFCSLCGRYRKGGHDCPMLSVTHPSSKPEELAARNAIVVSARVHPGLTNVQ